MARNAVARALRPKRVPSMATTSAAGTSQLASTRLSRPAARSAATFHSDRIATPCPATAHSRTTAPSLLHMVGRMRTVCGSRDACRNRHSVTSSSFSLTTRQRCRPKSEGDWIGENEARNYYVNRYAYQIVVVDKRRYWVRNLSYGFASGFLRRLALVLDECFAGWYDINEETCGRVVIRIPEGHTLEIAQETFRRCTGESLFIHADMQLPSVA